MHMKHITWYLLGALVLIGASVFFMVLYATKTISSQGVTFAVPRHANVQHVASTAGNYNNTIIANSRSTITISVPLKATTPAFNILEAIQPWGTSADVSSVTLHGRVGQRATYRQDSTSNSDVPTHARVTLEVYPSTIPSSPIQLQYIHRDGDDSLDSVWETVRESIRW